MNKSKIGKFNKADLAMPVMGAGIIIGVISAILSEYVFHNWWIWFAGIMIGIIIFFSGLTLTFWVFAQDKENKK